MTNGGDFHKSEKIIISPHPAPKNFLFSYAKISGRALACFVVTKCDVKKHISIKKILVGREETWGLVVMTVIREDGGSNLDKAIADTFYCVEYIWIKACLIKVYIRPGTVACAVILQMGRWILRNDLID